MLAKKVGYHLGKFKTIDFYPMIIWENLDNHFHLLDMLSKNTNEIEIALKPGNSLQTVQCKYEGFTVDVCFKLELRNYTSFKLIANEPYATTSHVYYPSTDVKPGEWELIAGRKSRSSLRGLECVFTWNIGDTGKILSVMFYLPYTLVVGKGNQLAIGIHDVWKTWPAKEKLKQMYAEDQTNFENKFFSGNVEAIRHSDDKSRFSVVGLMGKDQNSHIVVTLTASKPDEHSITGN